MAKQITFEERVCIEEFLGQQCSAAEIARKLQRSESTISRELSRNGHQGVYLAKLAQSQSDQRRCERPLVRTMDRPEIREAVENRLIQHWAPDQISGAQRTRLPTQPQNHVSASTIYRWIAQQGPKRTHWQQFLRRRGRKPYHPRKPTKPGGKPIRNRPPIIDRRERLGDFEGDLVLGRPGTGPPRRTDRGRSPLAIPLPGEGQQQNGGTRSREVSASAVEAPGRQTTLHDVRQRHRVQQLPSCGEDSRHEVILRRSGLSAPTWYE